MTGRALILMLLAAGAQARWLEVRSDHFQVLTDAGEAAGRDALARFEQIRSVLGPSRESPLPVCVYVFSSASDFRQFRSGESTRGFYQSGPDRDYIALERTGEETYRIVYHEYMHLVLNHTSVKLPLWFEEGVAEFYSTIESAGNRLRIGRPVRQHVATLLDKRWLTAAELKAMRKDSPFYREGVRSGLLYAQSWALVHMLNTAPGYREKMEDFAGLLADAVGPDEAFPRAFGKTIERALDDLRAVVSARRFPVAEVEWRPAASATPQLRSLDEQQALLARAELFLAVGREAEALKIYERLAKGNVDSAAVEHGMGQIMLARKRYDAARDHLKRAMDLGSREADVYFEYAMLLRDSGGSKEEVRDYLKKTLEFSPNYSEALFLLGNMALLEEQLDEAVGYFERATKVLPRQFYFWHTLALAYHQKEESALSERAARRALDCAGSPQEEEMARAALRQAANPNRDRR